MLESLFNNAAGPEALFPCEFCKAFKGTLFLQLIILDYIILYQTRTPHPFLRRITSTLYESMNLANFAPKSHCRVLKFSF